MNCRQSCVYAAWQLEFPIKVKEEKAIYAVHNEAGIESAMTELIYFIMALYSVTINYKGQHCVYAVCNELHLLKVLYCL